jgi:hypothetical protein
MSDPENIFQRIAAGEWDLPTAEAPPVDEHVLRQYVVRSLPTEVSRRMSLLIVSYRAWRDRYAALVAEAALGQKRKQDVKPS